ncbi:hypothetical protein BD779DRAFT_1499827 [Infundibulicybe gibba]|nr:hypothetical protein BD779DRAFT_1499827 [Infundibulicybe gibba]
MDSKYVLPLARVIRDAIRGLKELRKMSRRTQTLFATDLAMIGLGVRTGYLVDVVTIPNATETFSSLIQHLRKEYPAFAAVVHLYEPTTSQSFFVNIRLLFDVRDPGAMDGCTICQQTSFVSIGPNDQMSLVGCPSNRRCHPTPLSLRCSCPARSAAYQVCFVALKTSYSPLEQCHRRFPFHAILHNKARFP